MKALHHIHPHGWKWSSLHSGMSRRLLFVSDCMDLHSRYLRTSYHVGGQKSMYRVLMTVCGCVCVLHFHLQTYSMHLIDVVRIELITKCDAKYICIITSRSI